jgi:hypothetical protein
MRQLHARPDLLGSGLDCRGQGEDSGRNSRKHQALAGRDGAFVTGPATTLQIMVKNSKKYTSTGGWGFGRFIGGKPARVAQHETCSPCHEAHAKGQDYVFTRHPLEKTKFLGASRGSN